MPLNFNIIFNHHSAYLWNFLIDTLSLKITVSICPTASCAASCVGSGARVSAPLDSDVPRVSACRGSSSGVHAAAVRRAHAAPPRRGRGRERKALVGQPRRAVAGAAPRRQRLGAVAARAPRRAAAACVEERGGRPRRRGGPGGGGAQCCNG